MAHPLLDDLPALVCFARVVELGSFTKAAAALEVSKSVVSERVAALEARIGAPLLLRTSRMVTVTAAGYGVYGHAREVAAAGLAATASAAFASEGVLRVSAPITLANMHLAAPIASFLAARPTVKMELSLSDRLVDLVEERIDLAIRVTKLADSGLVARRLAESPMVVCGAPAYLDARGRPGRPEELARHACLRYALLPAEHEWRLYDGGRRVDVTVGGVFETTSGTMLREAAIAGLGLAVLPRFMVHDAIERGELEVVLGPFAPRPIGIHAVRAGRREAPALVRDLVAVLERALASAPWAVRRRR